MRLTEIYNPKPQFAWFEPSVNKSGMNGVKLAFVEPSIPRFDAQIADATDREDVARQERVKTKRDNYRKQGQLTFPHAPNLGWWLNQEDFENGENNEAGLSKGNIYQRYPKLEIFPSRKEAEVAAQKAGVIQA